MMLRSSTKRSEIVRAVRLVLAVTVFVFGLGFVSIEEPDLFGAEPASAGHCVDDGTATYDWCLVGHLVEAMQACVADGGTWSLSPFGCVYRLFGFKRGVGPR